MAKLAVVTGANTGIGKEIARGLAGQGLRVVMACRDPRRGEEAVGELSKNTRNRELSLMILDLASLASIRDFARDFAARFGRLDILVNNAGVALQNQAATQEGFDAVFGVNFLGPFLLTNLLLPALRKGAPSRIVNVASSVHKNGTIDRNDPQMRAGWRSRQAYANSKLADVLFTRELARRLDGSGVTANCYNPGLVRSEFFRNYDPVPFMLRVVLRLMGKTPAAGADTGVHLAISPEVEGLSGRYFENRRIIEPSAEAAEEELAKWLWEYASGAVGLAAR